MAAEIAAVFTIFSTSSPRVSQRKCHILLTRAPWQPRPIRMSIFTSSLRCLKQVSYRRQTLLACSRTLLSSFMDFELFLNRENLILPVYHTHQATNKKFSEHMLIPRAEYRGSHTHTRLQKSVDSLLVVCVGAGAGVRLSTGEKKHWTRLPHHMCCNCFLTTSIINMALWEDTTVHTCAVGSSHSYRWQGGIWKHFSII